MRRREQRPFSSTAGFAVLVAAAIAVGAQLVCAASARGVRWTAVETRTPGQPIMAIISLRSQQISVYDAAGLILRAPVSSGQKGRETPAGVFSIIQKEAEHYSNLYDDAYMPHMQRLTWSGIALHGGVLPGYAASHGCVRLPYDFAERLFDATALGMRVIVAPTDVAPVAIDHPALFEPSPGAAAAAAARASEAAETALKADQARLAALIANRDLARANIALRLLDNQKHRTETQLAAAEAAAAAAQSPEAKQQAEDSKAKAAARLSELASQELAAQAGLQPLVDAATAARQAASAAATRAADAARQVVRDQQPVSVFISRKAQRLYVRQNFQPLLDVPVTIEDADRPIGTHVFTAVGRTDDHIRWTVVSLTETHSTAEPVQTGAKARVARSDTNEAPAPGDAGAKAALDRITIPKDLFAQIAGMVTPRSSLIISDEPLSAETGEGTEFVVVLSGEPQGGLKARRRATPSEFRDERADDRMPYWRSPGFGRYSTW